MPVPRFSEFLSQRRRQLGLSIGQASRVLRMKEQVIQAFEEGDWNRIPRSGYAQGMLSSYARYLGLNPREVIDLFQDDLMRYSQQHGEDGSRAGANPAPGLSEGTPHAQTRRSRPGDRDLYGSAGPAGSILTGSAFGTHTPGASSPLVGTRNAGYSSRFSQPHRDDDPGRDATSRLSPSGAEEREGYPQGRPYTSRDPRRRTTSGQTTRRTRVSDTRSKRASADARRIVRDDITTRTIPADSYSDDLRYDQASPYERSTSERGRAAMRGAQRPERPRVRRRPSTNQRQQLKNRARPPRSGIAGVIEAWFSDSRRTLLTIVVAMALILTLVIVFSVRACTNRPAPDNKSQIPVSTAASGTDDSQDDSSDTTSDDASSAATTTKADDAEKEPEKVEVTVAVADGQVSWVEIKLDGKSEVARSITGPWEQSFDVVDSMEIRVADPAAVTVTKNGVPVQFDTKTSGIGTCTIEGSGQAAEDSGDDSTSSGSDDSGSTSSGSSSSTSSKEGAATSQATGTSGNGTTSSSSGN